MPRCGSKGASLVRLVAFVFAFMVQWRTTDVAYARSMIIYYANETVPEALESRNYRALFAILGKIQNTSGFAAAESLRSDSRTFRAKVIRDVASLRNVAGSGATDLAVFTNALALQGKYLVVRTGVEELATLDLPRSGDDPVTEYSPLASKVNFGIAIFRALKDYDDSDEIILIINSHGTKNLAVIPRLAADFTKVDVGLVRKQLESEQGDDLAIPAVELRGITKIGLWQQIDKVTSSLALHFSLVFLQACESAASSWTEYFSVPLTVTYVAHTGFTSISPEQFDYALLSEATWPVGEKDQVQQISSFLQKTGVVHFDSRFSYWRWPLLVTLASVSKWAFFVPLVLWLFMISKKMYRERSAKGSQMLRS